MLSSKQEVKHCIIKHKKINYYVSNKGYLLNCWNKALISSIIKSVINLAVTKIGINVFVNNFNICTFLSVIFVYVDGIVGYIQFEFRRNMSGTGHIF